jgi:hypothetical protein
MSLDKGKVFLLATTVALGSTLAIRSLNPNNGGSTGSPSATITPWAAATDILPKTIGPFLRAKELGVFTEKRKLMVNVQIYQITQMVNYQEGDPSKPITMENVSLIGTTKIRPSQWGKLDEIKAKIEKENGIKK